VTAVLIARGRIDRPYLGIAARGEELRGELVGEAGQPRALRVHGVSAGTPAESAGLRAGDLLLRAETTPVFGIDDLQRTMVLSGADELTLELLRNRERRSTRVRPARRAA
jgi:S1-C subfamily serine protease